MGVIVKVRLTSTCTNAYPLICEGHGAECLELLQPAVHSRGWRWGRGGEVAFDVINGLDQAFPLQEQGSGINNRHPIKRHAGEGESDIHPSARTYRAPAALESRGGRIQNTKAT